MAINLVGVDCKIMAIMVMNEQTWEDVKNTLAEDALKTSNPMEHLNRWSGVEVVIDNEVRYNHVEVYPSMEFYETVVKYGKRSDTDAGDVG